MWGGRVGWAVSGSEATQEHGEILGVCTTPEAAEAVRAEALTRRVYWYHVPQEFYGAVTVTAWSGDGPSLVEGRAT